MSREKGDNGSCRPPFRPFVDESEPRPDKSTSGSLVTKRPGECPGGDWNLRIISQATAPRIRETMLLLALPFVSLQDNCRRDAAIIRRIIARYPLCNRPGQGLEGDWELAQDAVK